MDAVARTISGEKTVIDSKGRTYIKIYCCGDCVQYNWTRHRCSLGAHVNGNANDCFYLDCPFLKEEKEQAWIPVTERLPQYGNYLVSFKTDEETDIGTFDPETGLWSACDADGFYYVASRGLEVIAWAPLPKPYGEEK